MMSPELPRTKSAYLPDTVVRAMHTKGAHFMCILKKAVARGIDVKTAPQTDIDRLADECVAEGKLLPVKKYFQRLRLEKIR